MKVLSFVNLIPGIEWLLCVVEIDSFGLLFTLHATVSDLKLHLQGTDYGPLLANDPSPLMVQTIDERLKERLVHEFTHIRNQCTAPMSEFLDYITYG